MKNHLDPTKAKIIALARLVRGGNTRRAMFGDEAGISFNTYANFESGKSWPRAAGLRRIEAVLGWKNGAIEEALAADINPAYIQNEHMMGNVPFIGGFNDESTSTSSKVDLREASDADLIYEVHRRFGREIPKSKRLA